MKIVRGARPHTAATSAAALRPWRRIGSTPPASVSRNQCARDSNRSTSVRNNLRGHRALRRAKQRPAMAQELRNTTGYRAWGGGAAMRGGADADATSIFLRFDSKKLKVRYNKAVIVLIRSEP
ncbi:hypothetical protein F511_47061 [Dorcoceras hygrometricum]|uniref:Uncharacterized protein n=1 Tax=Dorcoceras hygrometricum TaxID=472368 RepID=A0A2Z6ZRY4_9LAMI|nr:hypothetical protein F511_47061 [Dorcoceras hygrometricum]